MFLSCSSSFSSLLRWGYFRPGEPTTITPCSPRAIADTSPTVMNDRIPQQIMIVTPLLLLRLIASPNHYLYRIMQTNSLEQRFGNLKYIGGFGNTVSTEALTDAVPQDQNSPNVHKLGLYPEQISGTAFVAKRHQNLHTWVYKLRPSVVQGQYKKSNVNSRIVPSYLTNDKISITPNQLRWKPIPDVKEGESRNFVEGLVSVAGAGEPSMKEGIAIYVYSANKSMENTAMYNSDGDFLIVPYHGDLFVTTQMGKLKVSPWQVAIIPRGIKFQIQNDGLIKGWVAEIFRGHFELPELGFIGANGMAVPKDFEAPTAFFDDRKVEFKLYNKYIGELFQTTCDYSPFDIVGWRGNYTPYKYNMKHYNTIGSISYDHPDPCIFTVLTCPSQHQAHSTLDFVIFPPRWLIQQHTFKPPYYHRNTMSEYMGSIAGHYDAKVGFVPGASSLHSCMTGHGPDSTVYQKETGAQEKPVRIPDTNLAFMFETMFMLKTTEYAMGEFLTVDDDYYKCWTDLKDIKIEGQKQ